MTEEQLEKKLRFLKESLESGIISEKEYIQKKSLVEKELNDLKGKTTKKGGIEKEEAEDVKEDIKIEEIKQDKLKELEERKEAAKKEEKTEDLKEEIEELQDKEKPDKKKKKKLIIYSILILIVFLIIYFYAFKETNREKEDILEFKPACIYDNDCKMENRIGVCLNPNTTEAKCEFKDDKKVSLTVVNDKDCVGCDTTRMFQIIKKLFPLVEKTEIDYNSDEGKKLVEQLGIEVLPSYIFDSEIQDTLNFDRFKRALIKKEDKFIINPSASGSDYYFKRKEITNKLDLFVLSSTSDNIENNMQEFLNLFKDKISYSKHIIQNEQEKNDLNEELGITTYPSFLINNQLKFTGVQSAESIKNKFCEINRLPECETKLSESIK